MGKLYTLYAHDISDSWAEFALWSDGALTREERSRFNDGASVRVGPLMLGNDEKNSRLVVSCQEAVSFLFCRIGADEVRIVANDGSVEIRKNSALRMLQGSCDEEGRNYA